MWGTDEYVKLAFGVLELLVSRHLWVHRRVEALEFIDEIRVRRKVSVDFWLPTWEGYKRVLEVLPSGFALVPLTSLRKGSLRNFDVTDQSGEALPTLTKAQNQRLGFALLISQAVTVAFATGVSELPPQITADMGAIVSTDNVQVAEERRHAFFSKTEDGALRRALASDELFPLLLAELSRDFLLSVVVRAKPGERHIVKYSYEDSLRPHGNIPGLGDRVRRWLVGRLGWSGVELATTLALGTSGTHHIEVPAPDELYVERARLLVGQNVVGTDGPAERIHIRTTMHTPTQGLVVLTMRLQPRGVLTAAFLVSVFIWLLLAGGALLHYAWRIERAGDVVPSVLLAVPGVFGAYLFTPGQHRLLRKLFVGIRVVVLAITALSFAAAILLAVKLPPGTRPKLWYGLAGLATVAMAALTAAFISSWIGDHPVSGRNVREV